MNRLMKKIAEEQNIIDLTQKNQQIEQILNNVKTELTQVTQVLQDPLLQSNGNLIGIDAKALSDVLNLFLSQINPILNT